METSPMLRFVRYVVLACTVGVVPATVLRILLERLQFSHPILISVIVGTVVCVLITYAQYEPVEHIARRHKAELST